MVVSFPQYGYNSNIGLRSNYYATPPANAYNTQPNSIMEGHRNNPLTQDVFEKQPTRTKADKGEVELINVLNSSTADNTVICNQITKMFKDLSAIKEGPAHSIATSLMSCATGIFKTFSTEEKAMMQEIKALSKDKSLSEDEMSKKIEEIKARIKNAEEDCATKINALQTIGEKVPELVAPLNQMAAQNIPTDGIVNDFETTVQAIASKNSSSDSATAAKGATGSKETNSNEKPNEKIKAALTHQKESIQDKLEKMSHNTQGKKSEIQGKEGLTNNAGNEADPQITAYKLLLKAIEDIIANT